MNIPPGPGSFCAFPRARSTTDPLLSRGLHASAVSPSPSGFTIPSYLYVRIPHLLHSAGYSVSVLNHESRVFIGFFSTATLLVSLSADMPRSSLSRVHRTTSIRISNAVVGEVAHASAPLLRADAPLPHCAADGARTALATDCQLGRECGTGRGRLRALHPAVQARWGSISANS
jgi:hypothetical protein